MLVAHINGLFIRWPGGGKQRILWIGDYSFQIRDREGKEQRGYVQDCGRIQWSDKKVWFNTNPIEVKSLNSQAVYFRIKTT